MDTTDPQIRFLADGTCNHCNDFLKGRARLPKAGEREQRLAGLVDEIRQAGRGKPYDCIVGVSGGVDSTYVAYLARELGLRPLAVHLDNGWNSELAVMNIENTLSKLGIDLHTHVLDWETFRALQVSFLEASVPDAEIPTDHAIRAALWHAAAKYGVKYLLNGRNHTTEGILPWSWTYNALDWRYIKGVHRTFSRSSLRRFPHTSLAEIVYRASVTRFRNIGILDYVGFSKADVMDVLTNRLGWRDYGGKHYESIYTRFFQSYILPEKFGIDKRKAHYSVLILTGQMTRQAALEKLQEPTAPASMIKEDREFVLQKLHLSDAEFDAIMAAPIRSYRDYPNNSWVFLMHDNPRMMRLARTLRSVGVLPRGFGDNLLAEDAQQAARSDEASAA
jgi:N-acetyl sugar amidotransferase